MPGVRFQVLGGRSSVVQFMGTLMRWAFPPVMLIGIANIHRLGDARSANVHRRRIPRSPLAMAHVRSVCLFRTEHDALDNRCVIIGIGRLIRIRFVERRLS